MEPLPVRPVSMSMSIPSKLYSRRIGTIVSTNRSATACEDRSMPAVAPPIDMRTVRPASFAAHISSGTAPHAGVHAVLPQHRAVGPDHRERQRRHVVPVLRDAGVGHGDPAHPGVHAVARAVPVLPVALQHLARRTRPLAAVGGRGLRVGRRVGGVGVRRRIRGVRVGLGGARAVVGPEARRGAGGPARADVCGVPDQGGVAAAEVGHVVAGAIGAALGPGRRRAVGSGGARHRPGLRDDRWDRQSRDEQGGDARRQERCTSSHDHSPGLRHLRKICQER